MTIDGQPGPWPEEFPVLPDGTVRECLVVRSQSGTIEGRTTNARRPCISKGCPGWFLTVSWETGPLMHICPEGWRYDPASQEVRVAGGGELSARFVSPKPLGTRLDPARNGPIRRLCEGRAGGSRRSADRFVPGGDGDPERFSILSCGEDGFSR